MRHILIGMMVSVLMGGCGVESVTAPVSVPASLPKVDPAPTGDPAKPVVLASKPRGHGSHSIPAPTPECVVDVDCGEGFACVDGACVELPPPEPECAEDNPCVDADKVCSEGSCVYKACADDSECSEGNTCDNTTLTCRPLYCAAPVTTIDPNSIVVSPDGTGTTAEEIQADISFTIGQLQLVYPDLSLLSTNITTCEILEQVSVHQAQFDELDAVRIELDNHLASQNIRLASL